MAIDVSHNAERRLYCCSFTLKDIERMCMPADHMGMPVLARVPNNQPSAILQFLDRGVMGIHWRHIETRENVEALVRACKFAPNGLAQPLGYVGQPEDPDAVKAREKRRRRELPERLSDFI
ncbi:MAG: hypothetical protein JW741_02350 [Sedimentisphaerales bacterium]|nr:hypothetical protein [Sedimentisphaerales bacterium]